MSCSIRGLAEFWNLKVPHDGIIKEVNLYVGLKPNAFFCHINRLMCYLNTGLNWENVWSDGGRFIVHSIDRELVDGEIL